MEGKLYNLNTTFNKQFIISNKTFKLIKNLIRIHLIILIPIILVSDIEFDIVINKKGIVIEETIVALEILPTDITNNIKINNEEVSITSIDVNNNIVYLKTLSAYTPNDIVDIKILKETTTIKEKVKNFLKNMFTY